MLVVLNGKPMKFDGIKIERSIRVAGQDEGWVVYEPTVVVIVWLYTKRGFYGTYKCEDDDSLIFCKRKSGRYLTIINGKKRDDHDKGFISLIKSWHPQENKNESNGKR